MSRSERLFDLLQALRQHRRPVTGKVLADEMGVSIRTLYRDVASLQGLGAAIEGEPRLELSGEVDTAYWVPLDELEPTTTTVNELRGEVPAYRPVARGSELVVWGITFGILELLRGV